MKCREKKLETSIKKIPGAGVFGTTTVLIKKIIKLRTKNEILDTEIVEVENKICNHDVYITTLI